MSKPDNSLDNTTTDARTSGTVADHVALSQDQWASMRGSVRDSFGGASGSAAKVFDLDQHHLDFDASTGSGSFSSIGRTEAEKRRVITSAVRGAESVEDLKDAKLLELSLDRRDDHKDRGFIDCFGDIYKRMQKEKELGQSVEDLDGQSGGAIGRKLANGSGSIGRSVADTAGTISQKLADTAGSIGQNLADTAGSIGRDLADVAGGIAGHEFPSRDGGIYLPPADNGDRPIGIVPANRYDPRNPGVPTDTWGQK